MNGKSVYESDEDSFVEPPKLSRYSLALLNQVTGEFEAHLEDDQEYNDYVSGERQERQEGPEDQQEYEREQEQFPVNQNYQEEAYEQDIVYNNVLDSGNVEELRAGGIVTKKNLRTITNRKFPNPIGRPRRVSNRKSSLEIDKKIPGNNESVNDSDKENFETIYGEHKEDSPKSYASSMVTHNMVYRTNTIPTNYQTVDEQEYIKKTGQQKPQQNEEELYETLRLERARQEEIEQEAARQRLQESERHRLEEQYLEQQNSKKSRLEKIQQEANMNSRYHVVSEIVPLKEEQNTHTSPSNKKQLETFVINGTKYEMLELIGKGGTSKVYKAKSLVNNKVYAIKKVVFDEFHESNIEGFKGEISLLEKLRSKKRVVRLIDYTLQEGALYLVMECGEIDLAHVLHSRLKLPLDVNSVRFYATEILKCVDEVHNSDIVHSDLKPANFLFVKGVLKLIDFGISNAVPDHTVNIYRDSQIGTPNYMAPEALVDANISSNSADSGARTWKVGKPSDVWSCGCIIYQMVYGTPPYGRLNGNQRLLAIMNPNYEIQYPDVGVGNVAVPKTAVAMMKSCLKRDPSERSTVAQLLKGPFLSPKIVTEKFLEELIASAISYGAANKDVSQKEVSNLAAGIGEKLKEFNY